MAVSASEAVLLLLLVGCGFFEGFVVGIWFVLGGGLYVNEYGAVDIRWPPGPRKRL